MKKRLLGVLVISLFLFGFSQSAQAVLSPANQALVQQITAQIAVLQQQLLQAQATEGASNPSAIIIPTDTGFGGGPNTPASKFQIGDKIVTISAVNVRECGVNFLGLQCRILVEQPTGATGIVTGGPKYSNGYTWWYIDYLFGKDGFSAETLLEKDTTGPTSPNVPINPTTVSVDLKANGSDGPISVMNNSIVGLSWTSTGNPTNCNLNGVDGTEKPTSVIKSTLSMPIIPGIPSNLQQGSMFLKMLNLTTSYVASSGSENTQNLLRTRTYEVVCNNATVNDSVTVNISNTPTTSQNLSVDLKANGSDGPLSIASGETHTFQWETKNGVGVTTCALTANPVWNLWADTLISTYVSGGAVSGSSVGPFTKSETLTVTCRDDASKTASDSIQVNVGATPITTVAPPSGTVTVDLKVNGSDGPVAIANGAAATLTWSSTNASTCFSSLSGVVSTSNTAGQSTGNLTNSKTYTISCSNYTGSVSVDSVVVNVAQAGGGTTSGTGAGTVPAPVVTLSLTPMSISSGQFSTIKWSSTGATSCTMKLSPTAVFPNGYSYPIALSGTDTASPTQTVTYTATCTNSAGISGSDTKTLTVGSSSGPAPALAPVVNFSATPTAVQTGQFTNLTWTTSGASSCTASGGSGIGVGAWSGSMALNQSPNPVMIGPINQSVTLTLSCIGPGGTTVKSVTVVTTPIAPPPTTPPATSAAKPILSVNPSYNFGTSAVNPGTTSVLDWSSTGATMCIGPNWLNTPGVGPGSQRVGPIWPPATYTLTCFDSNNVSASASVTFTAASTVSATPSGAPPTINFSINPNYNFGTTAVNPGTTSVLDWSTVNATSCLGPNWLMTPGVGPGSQRVGPIWPPVTYTLTCTGPGGTNSSSISFTDASVQSTSVPTVSLSVSPTSISSGQNSSIVWSSTNATSCRMDLSTGYGYVMATSGSDTVSPTQTVTYTATCTNSVGSKTATATVTVSSAGGAGTVPTTPPVPTAPTSISVDIKANGSDGPITVTYGGAATLSWSSANATACYSTLGGSVSTSGTQSTGNLTGDTTYVISCADSAGNVWVDSVQINVTQATPTMTTPTVNLSINQSFGTGGNTATAGTYKMLDWSETNATNCYLSSDAGLNQLIYNIGANTTQTNSSGSQSVGPINQVTTYKVTCTGPGGTNSASVVINVTPTTATVPAPTVSLNYNNSVNPVSVASGGSVNFNWSATNVTSCQFLKNGAVYNNGIYSSPSNTVNYSSTFYVPNITSSGTYGISCSGPGGSNSSNSMTVNVAAPVAVTPAPTVNLSINPNYNFGTFAVNPGTTSVLDWSSSGATSCSGPNWLNVAGVGPGSQSVGPIWPPVTYTLTCYNSAGVSASKSVSFNAVSSTPPPAQTVTPTVTAPTVTISVSPTTIRSGFSSVLSWTKTAGSVCTINSSPYSGSWNDASTGTSGIQQVYPTVNTTYSIYCSNSVGTSATQNSTVTVTPSLLFYNSQPNREIQMASAYKALQEIIVLFQEYLKGQ
jgi:hypothetical protein